MNDFQFPKKARVRLKDGVDDTFYNGLAKVGNEGWLTGRRKDHLGFPEVYIHWDSEHWSYNHQPDCWTYEGHFDLVEEPPMEKDDKRKALSSAAADFASQIAKLLELDEPDDDDLEQIEAEENNSEPRFNENVGKAIELLKREGTEAFILATMCRTSDGDREGLQATVAHDSTTPEAETAIGAQLSHLAAQFHEAAAILSLYGLAQKRDKQHGPSQ